MFAKISAFTIISHYSYNTYVHNNISTNNITKELD